MEESKMETLENKKEANLAKPEEVIAPHAHDSQGQQPPFNYRLILNGASLPIPNNFDLPVQILAAKSPAPPVVVPCSVVGCPNPVKYYCSLTEKPLCSWECEQKNLQKRREVKMEESKKRTMETLENRKEAKQAKLENVIAPQNIQGQPPFNYRLILNGASIPTPKNFDLPFQKLAAKKASPVVVPCSVVGCPNPKRYFCSRTKKPLCSLECYQKNLQTKEKLERKKEEARRAMLEKIIAAYNSQYRASGNYKLTPNGASMSMPENFDSPVQNLVAKEPPPVVVPCAIVGCPNPIEYYCTRTRKPLCSMECYEKNLQLCGVTKK